MMIKGDLTSGGEHTIQFIDDVLHPINSTEKENLKKEFFRWIF